MKSSKSITEMFEMAGYQLLNEVKFGSVDRVVIAEKPYSKVPADSYLTIVLCWLPNNESNPFVVWTRNHAERCQGDSSGDYCRDIVKAAEAFGKRGVSS